MFILRTGLQGNGKTLNTIKEVDEKAAKEGRTVYYHNVTGLNPEAPILKATWIEFDNPEKWFELPLNAIIVIDEAQKFFRVRPQGSPVPEYASALETMRKQGHELHCITQNPKLIDAHFRSLCNGHIHYSRGHQGKVIKRWRFETPVDIDRNKNSLERFGEATRITLDKRYFGVYQSVQDEAGHHFKFRPPRALFVFLVLVVLIAYGSWHIYKNRIAVEVEQTASAAHSADKTNPLGDVSGGTVAVARSPQAYIAAYRPRVADVPASAPAYDELTKPRTYPKPSCVSTRDEGLIERQGSRFIVQMHRGRLYGCRCNSQQGTRLDISFEACISYVENGWFDPAKPDPVAFKAAPLPDQQVIQGAGGQPDSGGGTPAPAQRPLNNFVGNS